MRWVDHTSEQTIQNINMFVYRLIEFWFDLCITNTYTHTHMQIKTLQVPKYRYIRASKQSFVHTNSVLLRYFYTQGILAYNSRSKFPLFFLFICLNISRSAWPIPNLNSFLSQNSFLNHRLKPSNCSKFRFFVNKFMRKM